MLSLDVSPLLRFAVGFDDVAEILENASRLSETAGGYPPYDIVKTGEDSYRIAMAVAGFSPDEIGAELADGVLTVSGRKAPAAQNATYLHHGLAERAFERRFRLANFVEVTGATLENGLLEIELQRRLPEEKKPRRIEIADGDGGPGLIEGRPVDGKNAAA